MILIFIKKIGENRYLLKLKKIIMSNQRILPDFDTNHKLTEDQRKQVERAAGAFEGSRLAETIVDTFSLKTTLDRWGDTELVLKKWILPILHFLSGLTAFTGVTALLALLFATVPAADTYITNIGNWKIYGATLLGAVAAVAVLWLIESQKSLSLKNMLPTEFNLALKSQYGVKKIWRARLYAALWIALSFITSYFGGVETPAVITEKPTDKSVNLIKTDSVQAARDKNLAVLIAPYDAEIQRAKEVMYNNREKKKTDWRAALTYNAAAANKTKQEAQKDKIVNDHTANTAVLLKDLSGQNTTQDSTIRVTNTRNWDNYRNNVARSSAFLGTAALAVDTFILLGMLFMYWFYYTVALETEGLRRMLRLENSDLEDEETQPEANTPPPTQPAEPKSNKEPVKNETPVAAEKKDNLPVAAKKPIGFKDYNNYRKNAPKSKKSGSDSFIKELGEVEHGGVRYTSEEVQKIIKNLPVYWKRAAAPTPSAAKGKTAEKTVKAKKLNSEKCQTWAGVLKAAGVNVNLTSDGKVDMKFPRLM